MAEDGWSALQQGAQQLQSAIEGFGVSVEGKQNQKRAFRYNSALAKDAYERQKEFYNIQTAQNRQNLLDYYTLQRQSAENAGMSAAALMSSGGSTTQLAASGASVPQASVGMSPATRGAAMQLGMQAQALNSQIRLQNAQAKALETQAEGNTIDNANKQEGYDLQFDSMRAGLTWTEQQVAASKATVENMQKTFSLTEQTVQKNLGLLDEQTRLVGQQADKMARELFEMEDTYSVRCKQMLANLGLTNAQATQCARLAALYAIETTVQKHQHGAEMQVNVDGKNGYVMAAWSRAIQESCDMSNAKVDAEVHKALGEVQGSETYQWINAIGQQVGNYADGIGNMVNLKKALTGEHTSSSTVETTGSTPDGRRVRVTNTSNRRW